MSSVASPRPPQLPMKGNRFGKREPQPPIANGAVQAGGPSSPAAANGSGTGAPHHHVQHHHGHIQHQRSNVQLHAASIARSALDSPSHSESILGNGGGAGAYASMNGGLAGYHSDSNGSASTPTVPPRPKKAGIAPPLKPSKTSTMTLHRSPSPQQRSNLQRTATAPHPPMPPSNMPQPAMSHPFPLNDQERAVLEFQQQQKQQQLLQQQQQQHQQQHPHQQQQQQHPHQQQHPQHPQHPQQQRHAPASLHRSATGGGMAPPGPPHGISAPPTAQSPQSQQQQQPGGGTPQMPKPKMTKAERREKVAHEIVSTEETYVKSLKVLSDLYISPLLELANANKPVLSRKQIDVIFSNISLILPLNEKFREDLAARLEHWESNTSTVADVFRDFAPYFKMYTSYVNNHDNAVEALKKELESNEKFSKFCDAAEANPLSSAQKLASFLILPIQRIPRYRLLLQEMQKNTDEDHPYLQAESDALTLVKEVADQINESVRAQANRAQIISIQERFQGDVTFVEPSRRFIREGVLTKVCRSTDKKYMFFLFSDLLVYASRGFKLKLHRKIPIGNLFGFSDLDDTDSVKNRFQIASQNKSFVVYADSNNDKQRWLCDLTNVSVEVRKTLSHQDQGNSSQQLAPVWQPDVSSSRCTVCRANFSMFKRRHHCRRCGKLVCNECSKTRAILTANDKNKIQRVCDDCIVLLKRRDGPTANQEGDSSGESDSDDDNEVLCRAMYEYVADDERELTIRKGDIIRVVHRDPSGWWTGELGNQMGIFPSTYTQIIEQEPNGRDPYQYDPNQEANTNGNSALQTQKAAAAAAATAATASPTAAVGMSAVSPSVSPPPPDIVVVTTAYEAAGQGELTLQVGERIFVKNRHPSGWWCGRLDSTDEVGWFSPEFVEACDDAMSDALSEASSISSMQRVVTFGTGMCPDCTCSGFRPNTFRPNLCRECWHAETVHTG